jgi:hypothetical protein
MTTSMDTTIKMDRVLDFIFLFLLLDMLTR